jgi:hypothetical protein
MLKVPNGIFVPNGTPREIYRAWKGGARVDALEKAKSLRSSCEKIRASKRRDDQNVGRTLTEPMKSRLLVAASASLAIALSSCI